MENSKMNKTAQNQSSQSPQGSAQNNINSQSTSGMGGLGNIGDKLQQFSSSTAQKVGNLSTTQKVVGGSLLALGAGWVAMNAMNKNKGSHQTKTNKHNRRSA
jgi:hypothetical protein